MLPGMLIIPVRGIKRERSKPHILTCGIIESGFNRLNYLNILLLSDEHPISFRCFFLSNLVAISIKMKVCASTNFFYRKKKNFTNLIIQIVTTS